MMPHQYYGWEHGAGYGMWIMHWLIPLFTLVVIIVVIYTLIRWSAGDAAPGRREEEGDRALDILRERYAQGEIDREEFEQKRDDLTP